MAPKGDPVLANVNADGELRDIARELKAESRRLGFIACGISRAQQLDAEAYRLEEWLGRGYHASMRWMEGHFDKRIDPRKLVEGTTAVVSLLDNYYVPVSHSPNPETAKISRYAWGDDYHFVMKDKLGQLFAWLDDRVGGVNGRVFVDSAPVMDKAWAQRSGLGWIGKNANLISPTAGSYFFIGEMLIDLPLPADEQAVDHCGSCTRCIDACPTDAIVEPYVVDASKCISYRTIENRDEFIPETLASKFGNWVFGCDICQDVCPWNKFKQPTTESRYAPREGMVTTTVEEWSEISVEEFRERFRKNPVKRTKPEGLKRNANAVLSNRTG